MRFLLDQNLPASLIALLARLGHEADHIGAMGMGDASDHAIWAEALRRDAIVVSKDSDFLALAGTAGRLVRLRVGNRSNRDLFEIIERGLPAVIEALEAGERVVELRG